MFIVNHDVVIYNFRKEVAQALLDEGYEVYIVSPQGDRIPKLINMGCKFIEVPVDRHGLNPIKDFELILKYKKVIQNVQPLVVLTYTIKPNIYGGIAARALKVPYIANITGMGSALENPGMLQKFLVRLYRFAFKNVDTVFMQNQENFDFFINHKIASEKLALLPGSGVNLEEFTPLPYPDDDIVKFVFISRIMKEKGIEEYLAAAKEIKVKYPNTEFHICGFAEEDYLGRIHELENEGIIIYHGMVMDIREILKDMHCTIHPSFYPEGISNVLLESAACARPIITTDRAGCREVVKSDGFNGYIVPIKNLEYLKRKIEEFLLLPFLEKKKMGINSREFVAAKFDRIIILKEYKKAIRSIEYEK